MVLKKQSIPRSISSKTKILMIGCGGLGKSLLELNLLCGYIPRSWKDLDVIEPLNLGKYSFYSEYNINHYQLSLNPDNIQSVLHKLIPGKTIVLDVSIGINAIDIIKICNQYDCMYVNTSLENWEIHHPEKLAKTSKTLYPRTLHAQYTKLMKMKKSITSTTVFDHGMNPGLISHLAKKAIRDSYFERYGKNISLRSNNVKKNLTMASKRLGLIAIHISELDTQKLSKSVKFKKDTFYNTWSGAGMIAEGIDPIQVGHSKIKSSNSTRTIDDIIKKKGFLPNKGSKNLRYYPVRGMDRMTNTIIITDKNKEIKSKGYLIPHGEANTLSKYLNTPTYTPNVYYVYHPSEMTIKSLNNLRKNNYKPVNIRQVLDQRSLDSTGYDSIGAYLIFGDDIEWNWWTGTVLTMQHTKKLGLKYSGPTELQVAISFLSCVKWMLSHQGKGICSPEELPSDDIIKWCKPYLGKFMSRRVKKTPEIF